jgi:ketosteroid isomerase-like protein
MNKALWHVAPLAILLVGGLFACTKAPAAQDPERAALEVAIQRWTTAVNSQDVSSLTATMTEDVELLDANAATATGRDAAVRALREAVTHGRLVATTREITIANDVAWRVAGLARIRKEGVVLAHGQALEIWKRVNGEWRLHRQMAAGGRTPEDLLTRPSTQEPVLDRPRE